MPAAAPPRLSICAETRHASRPEFHPTDLTPTAQTKGENAGAALVTATTARLPPVFPPTRRPCHQVVTAVQARLSSQRQRRVSKLHGTPHRTRAPLARQYRTPSAQGGSRGGDPHRFRETSAPFHLALAAPMLQRSCFKGPRHSFALARIMTPALGQATPASSNDYIVFVRPPTLALFALAGGSPRPRHSALAFQRDAIASRTRFKTALALQCGASAPRPDS